MIIKLKRDIPSQELERLVALIEHLGLTPMVSHGINYNIIGLIGDTAVIDTKKIEANKYVDAVIKISSPYKKVNRAFHPEDSIVTVGNVRVGGKEKIALIGGPCSVESQEQILTIAKGVKEAGANMLRGGAYKPRTSPYAFQGLGTEGVDFLVKARETYGLPIVSELMGTDRIEEFAQHVDLIQIGARNMQNFDLLKAVGKLRKPIILKRGLANTIEEWLMSAEYIMAGGNDQVILCERGIRTFEKMTRNTLDLSVIPLVKRLSHLPIVIDPSHATGDWKLVESMSLAAIAAGADGLMIEVHNDPENALSDGSESLTIENFTALVQKGRKIAEVIGREL